MIAANYKWCMKWKIPVECTVKRIDSATMESTFATLSTCSETVAEKSTEKAVAPFSLHSICAFSICFPNQLKISISQTFNHIKLSKLPILIIWSSFENHIQRHAKGTLNPKTMKLNKIIIKKQTVKPQFHFSVLERGRDGQWFQIFTKESQRSVPC